MFIAAHCWLQWGSVKVLDLPTYPKRQHTTLLSSVDSAGFYYILTEGLKRKGQGRANLSTGSQSATCCAELDILNDSNLIKLLLVAIVQIQGGSRPVFIRQFGHYNLVHVASLVTVIVRWSSRKSLSLLPVWRTSWTHCCSNALTSALWR